MWCRLRMLGTSMVIGFLPQSIRGQAHFTAPFAHFRRMAGLRAKGAVQQDVKTQIKVRDLIKASKTVGKAKGHVLDAVLDKVRGLLMVDCWCC
jgi:hypothetical protein